MTKEFEESFKGVNRERSIDASPFNGVERIYLMLSFDWIEELCA